MYSRREVEVCVWVMGFITVCGSVFVSRRVCRKIRDVLLELERMGRSPRVPASRVETPREGTHGVRLVVDGRKGGWRGGTRTHHSR